MGEVYETKYAIDHGVSYGDQRVLPPDRDAGKEVRKILMEEIRHAAYLLGKKNMRQAALPQAKSD